jgi:hypothetical protein
VPRVRVLMDTRRGERTFAARPASATTGRSASHALRCDSPAVWRSTLEQFEPIAPVSP